MSTQSPSPDELRAFARVARLASFTLAAQQLQLPRATVSSTVLRLEKRLGARLLQRTTRRVRLTPEGEQLLLRAEAWLAELDELAGLFQQLGSPLTGRLRVDMPLGMAAGVLMAGLPGFLDQHPDLQVDVCSTDRRVDLVADGFDAVIRVGAVSDESLACRRLGHLPLVNVVSAGYAAAHGLPSKPDDLSVHWLVHYQPNPSNTPATFDYLDPRTSQTIQLPMRHRISVNNSAAYTAACRAGLGLVQVPRSAAQTGLEDGSLVEVLPQHRPAAMPVNLLFPHHRALPRRVQLFADWLTSLFQPAS